MLLFMFDKLDIVFSVTFLADVNDDRFMDNLQTEVLELEFLEFSHGMPTIKEEEFARILLRYTILTKEEHEKYLERLRKRITHEQVSLRISP